MDLLIPGNPGRAEMTQNVLYCSDVTVTVVALSAAITFITRAPSIGLLVIG